MIDDLVVREVAVQCLQQGGHAEALLVEDIELDCRQRVGQRADADALDVAGVVARAAGVVVLAFGDAVIDDDRQERDRHLFGVKLLDDLVATDLDVDKMTQLQAKGLEKLVKRAEIGRLAGVGPQLAAGDLVEAVI